MQDTRLKKIGRVSAYVVGGVLIFIGTVGLVIELSREKPSSTNFYGYALAVVCITSGVLACVAAKSHYDGGPWFLFGLICVATCLSNIAFVSQLYMRGRHVAFPVITYSKIAGLWGVGCYCLIWGHMRRHREKKDCHTQIV
jgi:hypothetical protein